MDAAGIDMQILSLTAPGVEQLQADEAVALARSTNDHLAQTVQRHPDRFAGFAALPTPAPSIAADELTRMAHDHGFKGAAINGHNHGRYLDDTFEMNPCSTSSNLAVFDSAIASTVHINLSIALELCDEQPTVGTNCRAWSH